jgi:ABC-type nitrate/sulfonate/bicarbonate transport system ATPase subunit
MAISLNNLSFSYDGKKKILDNFSIKFPEKGAVCLMGPSGCGKTTLLRILSGLEQLQSGTVTGLNDMRAAYVFQENRLLPWLSAIDNVSIASTGLDRQSDAVFWLEKVGLGGNEHKFPGELSGGMKQRVSIARALAAKADFLILDEPFAGLDFSLWKEISDVILDEYSDKLIILVTHIPEQAESLNADIIRLDGPPLRLI